MLFSLRHLKEILLISLLCGAFSCNLFCQEPSYEIFGSNELSGVTIYDQLMTEDEILFIATSDGLYTYNSINFHRIEQPSGAKGNAFFRLREDLNGDVFCTNLSGQLFRIRNDKMIVFYELPAELVAPFNNFILVKSGVIINGNKTVHIDKSGHFIRFLEKRYNWNNGILYTEEICADGDSVEFMHVIPENLRAIRGTEFRLHKNEYSTAAYMNSEFFCFYDHLSGELRKYTFKTGEIVKSKQSTLNPPPIILNDSLVWLKIQPYGVLETSIQDDFITQNTFFQDKYAAPQTVNQHGIFLGSNGYGIYQVRNRSVKDIVQLDQYNILEIKEGPEGTIIAKTSDRRVLLIDRDFSVTEVFKSENGTPYTFVDLVNNRLLIALLKELYIYHFSEKKMEKYSSELSGAKRMSMSVENGEYLYTGTWNMGSFSVLKGKVNRFLIKHGRAYSAISFQGDMFFGAYEDLIRFNPETKDTSKIRYKGQSIVARRFFKHDDQLFIQTAQNGFLQYENGALKEFKLSFDNMGEVREVFYDDESFIISDKKNLFLWNLNTNERIQFSRSDGLHSMNIRNAFIKEGQLFILTHLGIQVIDLDKIQKEDEVPKIHILDFWVNEHAVTETRDLAYWQNKIAFELGGNGFGKQFNTKFKYKLEGLSNDWMEKEYLDNVIEYQSLPYGSYTFRVLPVYKGQPGKEVRYSFVISPPFWDTWWFILICIVFLLIGTFLLYRWYYLRKLEKIQVESEINKLRLTAIQSQMNPHFIFNSINGIQKSVLKNDRKSTYRHINKFAKLVRIILNHSNQEVITLSEEIELLGLYLELEKMRFSDQFEFTLDLEADDQLQIPPMLVQPFIENAVIHGLFHKKGEKELRVKVEQHDVLRITITDNGIGRAASQEINEDRHKTTEKSFATSAVERRMNSLNRKYKTDKFGFEYIDLLDEEGRPKGTKVIITLQIIR